MSNDGTAVFILLLIALLTGGFLGYAVADRAWQTEAITHGVGEYNPETAEFQWKQPCP
jgi:hypothetical protein